MSRTGSQETVARLKQLLFDQEAREIDTLSVRISEMQQRAGSDEQFQSAVARVLDKALRDAEASRHKELAEAMAPMVLRTLRTEMSSPQMQDQIAGVMYPRMGEMVSRYVASAIKDMMAEINRRLEAGLSHNRFALWMRSIAAGRPMAEIALADTQRLEVHEIYLVRRGSGALLHHWQREGSGPAAGGDNRDAIVSGFLAAITALAEDAFEADKESLRTLDLDDHRIYLRGSPDHLLAAKCSGSTPAGIDRMLDAELIKVLGENQLLEQRLPDQSEAARAGVTDERDRLTGELAQRIEAAAAARTREISEAHGARTLRTLAWLIGLPLAALAGWYFYVSFVTSDLQRRADAALAAIPALTGYPVKAHVERGGTHIWVSGLAPDEAARRQIITSLKEVAPQAKLDEAIGVLPTTDVDARVGAEGLRRSLDRAQGKLSTLLVDLAAVRDRAKPGDAREALAAAEASARASLSELEAARNAAGKQPLEEVMRTAVGALRSAADRLSAIAGSDAGPAERTPASAIEGAESLALAADRISSLVAIIEQRINMAPIAARIDDVGERLAQRTAEVERTAEARTRTLNERLEARLAELEERLAQVRPAPPTARQRLEAFVRANAIFFGADAEFRSPQAAAKVLDELAGLVQAAGIEVRVVGFTDEAGGAARNSPLAQARADKVAAELQARGVPSGLIIPVGRASGANIATGSGAQSPNRRVEFEIAFQGEKGGRP